MKPWIGLVVGLVLLSSASAEGALSEPEGNNDGPSSSPGSVAAVQSVDVRSEPAAIPPETASTDQPPSAPAREPARLPADPPALTDLAEPPPADDLRPASPVDPPVPVWCIPRLGSADYPGHPVIRPCPVPWAWPCPPPIDRIGIIEVLFWPCPEPPPLPCPLLPDIVAGPAESGEHFRKCPIPPPIPCKTLHGGDPVSNRPEIWPPPCPPPPCPHPTVDGEAARIIWCLPVPPCPPVMDPPTTQWPCPIPFEPPLPVPPWPAPMEPGDDTKTPLPIAPTTPPIIQVEPPEDATP